MAQDVVGWFRSWNAELQGPPIPPSEHNPASYPHRFGNETAQCGPAWAAIPSYRQIFWMASVLLEPPSHPHEAEYCILKFSNGRPQRGLPSNSGQNPSARMVTSSSKSSIIPKRNLHASGLASSLQVGSTQTLGPWLPSMQVRVLAPLVVGGKEVLPRHVSASTVDYDRCTCVGGTR